jgi:hypothetical protein
MNKKNVAILFGKLYSERRAGHRSVQVIQHKTNKTFMGCSLGFFVNLGLLFGVIACFACLGIILVSRQRMVTPQEAEEHAEQARLLERERLVRLLDYTKTAEYPESLWVANFIDSVKVRLQR